MEFQIERLIVWSADDIGESNEVVFHPGKVNVVTGESRTGKSAIVPIIDYCLGADTCLIPTGLIRENAAWFGLLVRTEDSRLLIARQTPAPKKNISTRCYLSVHPRDGKWTTPSRISEAGFLDLKELKRRLNETLKVPYLDNGETDKPDPISYRDLMHLVFQSQDVVANPNILFYKMHETANRFKFQRWLEYLFAAESADSICAKNEVNDLKKEKQTLEKSAQLDELSKAQVRGNLRAFINEALEVGLYPTGRGIPEDDRQLLNEVIRLASIRDIEEDVSEEALTESENRIHRMRKDAESFDQELAIVEQRLSSIDELQKQFREYEEETRDDFGRLGISKWIAENWANHPCSICSGTGHETARQALDEVLAAVRQQEDAANARLGNSGARKLPRSIVAEKRDLNKRRKELTLKKREIAAELKIALTKDGDARVRHRRHEDACILVGRMRNAVENLRSITEQKPENKKRLEEIRERLGLLAPKIETAGTVEERLERNLNAIGVSAQRRLAGLDADSQYAQAPIVLDRSEINLKVAPGGDMSDYHLLGEIGSGSNWVACHLAYTCALQEFFTAQTDPVSNVPSFVVYDQPSQVYFPKMTAGAIDLLKNKKSEDGRDPDADFIAVKKMFTTLAASVKETGGKWQAIVLEHATEDVYGDIDAVVEVADWRNGNKLIPERWLRDNH